ncbi:MAG TPA: hypothetical protein VJ986_06600 [Gaiellaceae bacterium]|nr:hypothetical protein [Gaiellaceae bacterium]
MRVAILTFAGCPNGEPARALVAEVARELGREPAIEAVLVEDVETAERLRFLGSPTIRVDGRDVEPGADERESFALSCRVYPSPDGTSGLPPRSWIRSALERARG